MSDDQNLLPSLGPVKAWLVKDFPVSLREEVTRAATMQGTTVARWLIAHFQQHGIAGVEVTPVYQTSINTAKPADLPDLTELLELERLSHLARLLTSEGKSSKPLAEAKRLVWARLKALTNKWEAHEGEDSEAPRALAAPTT